MSRQQDVGAHSRAPSPGQPNQDVSGVAHIRTAFARAKAEGRPAFIPYITVGHPDRGTVAAVVPALIAAGADIVELGVPFSDPLADGPVIQRSTQTALANGVTLDRCLDEVRHLRRAGITVPLVFLGYMNPIAQKGEERFAALCAAAGVDGVIVADLPPEEAGDLRAACDRHGVALIAMLAPTSTEKRIAQVAQLATGFVYCVGLTGVTGERDALAPDLRGYLDRVRAQVAIPIAVGFGISRPEHVAAVGAMADGVIVGSALVNRLAELSPAERASGAADFVRWLTGRTEG
ncbi:MAG: tryptophan synthase subunit alpha [Thermomicrobiales bacterium]